MQKQIHNLLIWWVTIGLIVPFSVMGEQLAPVEQLNLPPFFTNDPATTPKGCIGDTSHPLCAMMTIMAAYFWEDQSLCRQTNFDQYTEDETCFRAIPLGSKNQGKKPWIYRYRIYKTHHVTQPVPYHEFAYGIDVGDYLTIMRFCISPISCLAREPNGDGFQLSSQCQKEQQCRWDPLPIGLYARRLGQQWRVVDRDFGILTALAQGTAPMYWAEWLQGSYSQIWTQDKNKKYIHGKIKNMAGQVDRPEYIIEFDHKYYNFPTIYNPDLFFNYQVRKDDYITVLAIPSIDYSDYNKYDYQLWTITDVIKAPRRGTFDQRLNIIP